MNQNSITQSSSSTQKPQEKLTLLKLPAKLLGRALSYLSDKDLTDASLACKTIYQNGIAWQEKLCREEHSTIALNRFNKSGQKDNQSWKTAYIDFRKQMIKDEYSSHKLIRSRPFIVEYGHYNKKGQLDTTGAYLYQVGLEGLRFIFRNEAYLTDFLRGNSKEIEFDFLQRPSNFFNEKPLIKISGVFQNGQLNTENGTIAEFDGRIIEGRFNKGQLDGQGSILESNGRELRGTFLKGRFITGNLYHLFPYLTVKVAPQTKTSTNVIVTDDGRQLEGSFPDETLTRGKNLGPLFGAVLRALERQYEQITLPTAQGKILKGWIVQGELFGEGRIIEAERELIGLFKSSKLVLGVICYSSSIELVDDEPPLGGSLSKKRKRSEDEPFNFNKKIKAKSEFSNTSSYNLTQQASFSSSSSSSSSKSFPLENEYLSLNGQQAIIAKDGSQLKGEFTNGQLNGKGVMILADADRVLIGEFQKGSLYNGYMVAKKLRGSLIHIQEGRTNFDFRGYRAIINEVMTDKKMLATVNSILNPYWQAQIAEEESPWDLSGEEDD